jgi:hypothetical protein
VEFAKLDWAMGLRLVIVVTLSALADVVLPWFSDLWLWWHGTTGAGEVYVFHLGCVITLPSFREHILQNIESTSSTTSPMLCEKKVADMFCSKLIHRKQPYLSSTTC